MSEALDTLQLPEDELLQAVSMRTTGEPPVSSSAAAAVVVEGREELQEKIKQKVQRTLRELQHKAAKGRQSHETVVCSVFFGFHGLTVVFGERHLAAVETTRPCFLTGTMLLPHCRILR